MILQDSNSSDVSTDDMLVGGLVILGFVFVAYWIGKLVNVGENRRFVKAWAPLITTIQGTISQDGGVGATSFLRGTYQGHTVEARMTPATRKYRFSRGDFSLFEVQLVTEPSGQDWRVLYETSILGMGNEGWQIKTDPALKEQLIQQGILQRIMPLGQSISITYTQRHLLLKEDVTPKWAPSPERFKQELDLLLYLADVNNRINRP